jgi:hypothetical protein
MGQVHTEVIPVLKPVQILEIKLYQSKESIVNHSGLHILIKLKFVKLHVLARL